VNFLDRIRPSKVAEADALRKQFATTPPARPASMPVRDFRAALKGGGGIIAEVKRTSPSDPSLLRLGPPGALARAYRRGGACALSIVTDAAHFGTSLADVASLREAVDLPILVKDFVIDTVQIQAAWAAGADAVLLIVSMLDAASLEELLGVARDWGLAVLVECHDEQEIAMARAAGAALIGVNNRNLKTLTTDLAHGEGLLPFVGDDAITVSESGLNRREDIERMARAGADAFLIGHALLLSPDPGRKVAELSGLQTEGTRQVKICGLTLIEDATAAHQTGAHLLGLVFAGGSRLVDIDQALAIRKAVPEARLCGVFQDQDPFEIARVVDRCDLDLIQLHGDESPEFCRRLAEATGRPLIKALRPEYALAETLDAYDAVAYFLVDRPKGDPGSVGPEALQKSAALIRTHGRNVFLAGGLTGDNVAAAIEACDPGGVDVSSGIEMEPGRKDLAALNTFMTEATS
jgi:indole-3-glycerol phosphate synthase/phosphoribosylanthranilate isomerase